jgi:hypothetical protein
MLFIPENQQDIAKYFRQTFLKFKPSPGDNWTGDTLFFIDNVDKYQITGRVDDGREFKLYLSDAHPYEVEYILPHKSFFQLDDTAVLLERVPARQYFRGVTTDNTNLHYRKNDDTIGTLELSFKNLKAFVSKQKFFTLSEAMAQRKVKSCVLNSRMMVVPENRQIYVDFTAIARVSVSPDNKIKMIRPLFRSELVRALVASNEQEKFTIQ